MRLNQHLPFLLAALALVACGETTAPLATSPEPTQAHRLTNDILGEDWVLVAFVDDDGTQTPATQNTRVTLAFHADGSLGGQGGCNGYGATWSQSEEGVLRIEGILSTLIACEEIGIMEQEQRLFRALEATSLATRTGESLRLDLGDTGDHVLFELVVREQVPPEPYTGILWQLDHFEQTNGDAINVIEVTPGTRLTAWFAEDGTARGSTGCNDWGARWISDDTETVRFEDVAATEKACLEPEGVMAQEQRYLDALIQIRQVASLADELWLQSADGTIGLRFRRAAIAGDILRIRGGTSFGHCLGYCWEEATLDAETFQLAKGGWDAATYPEISTAEQGDTALWRRMIGMPDVSALADLDEVIGCPDCADGGSEWIEIVSTSGQRRVTFEYGSPPKEIAALAQLLRAVRDQLRDGFGRATVILE